MARFKPLVEGVRIINLWLPTKKKETTAKEKAKINSEANHSHWAIIETQIESKSPNKHDISLSSVISCCLLYPETLRTLFEFL